MEVESLLLLSPSFARTDHTLRLLFSIKVRHTIFKIYSSTISILRDRAFFASLEKGWSNDVLGLQWLEHVFDRSTTEKASRDRRLLLVDGHGSHVNLTFIVSKYISRSLGPSLAYPVCLKCDLGSPVTLKASNAHSKKSSKLLQCCVAYLSSSASTA
jgi:DDE superfamily endonuclease